MNEVDEITQEETLANRIPKCFEEQGYGFYGSVNNPNQI